MSPQHFLKWLILEDMKWNRTHVLILLSSIALVIVLAIQVIWLFHTARIKEQLFNEKANMVLARTTEALLADQQACHNIQNGRAASEVHKIDSLFRYYMKFYNFYMNYRFDVRPKTHLMTGAGNFHYYKPSEPMCYEKQLHAAANDNGLELKLMFPEKEQFILAEMGVPFITSVILILLVLVISWRSTLSLLKEKQISEHTTDFLNNMTHEFKTPLTNIALAGKMIQRETAQRPNEKARYYSGIILEENDKLRLQVEQVLSMSALERGEIPLQKTLVDVHALLQDALKSLQLLMEQRQAHCQLDLAANYQQVMADKTHLTHAFCNLLDNAIHYSKGAPELSIHTYNNGGHLIIAFSDKGIGMEQGYHKKVFEKFFRIPTGDLHDVKGFGLGLAYVKAIVDAHGGSIELQSEKGTGTTFRIILNYV